MSVDPFDRLRRPVSTTPQEGTSESESRVRGSVAPEFVGPCLRLAGDAAVPALILRMRDGRLSALSYSYMTAVRLDPAGSVELDFVGHAVSVSGKRLRHVFDALAGQVAMELLESSGEFDEGGDVPFIESIAIVATQER